MARVLVEVPESALGAFVAAAPRLVAALCAPEPERLLVRAPRRSSKYAPIAAVLASRAGGADDAVVLSLRELDGVVAGGLPSSALRLTGWWTSGQDHARAWVAAGWWAEPLLPEGVVVFRRARSGVEVLA